MIRKIQRSGLAAMLASALAITLAVPAAADPPPWAPAHGYRKKQAAAYAVPFGIDLGRCNREVLGAALGGAVGAAAGSTIGKGDGKTAAVIGGAIIGILVGGAIGRSMDQVDQNCVGQALEHAHDNQPVMWRAPNGAEYTLRPGRTWKGAQNQFCRDYQTIAVIGGKRQQLFGKACRDAAGAWRLMS